MSTRVLLKTGIYTNLPQIAPSGEFHITTDTRETFVGTGSSVEPTVVNVNNTFGEYETTTLTASGDNVEIILNYDESNVFVVDTASYTCDLTLTNVPDTSNNIAFVVIHAKNWASSSITFPENWNWGKNGTPEFGTSDIILLEIFESEVKAMQCWTNGE